MQSGQTLLDMHLVQVFFDRISESLGGDPQTQQRRLTRSPERQTTENQQAEDKRVGVIQK
jgi:hypothetical protein